MDDLKYYYTITHYVEAVFRLEFGGWNRNSLSLKHTHWIKSCGWNWTSGQKVEKKSRKVLTYSYIQIEFEMYFFNYKCLLVS